MSAPLGADDHVVVVGAGLAGWRLCEGLRERGYTGRLTLVGAEPHPPYDRPPLSKQVLSGKWGPEHTALATDEKIEGLGLTLRLDAPATALDPTTGEVALADDTSVVGTRVVLATGARARRLPFTASAALHYLRTRDDAVALAAAAEGLAEGTRVVIIGGGFIGAEVATSLASRGLRPVVLEALERPLISILGDSVSTWLLEPPRAAGIDLRTRQSVSDVTGQPGALTVELAGGERMPSPLVVVGVGAEPNVEWLKDSGLTLDNGVVVDEALRATDRVYAVGDLARFAWVHGPFRDHVRLEHWQCATDHGAELSRGMVEGHATPLEFTPYFWSDQYGKKIQLLGHPAPTDDVERVLGSDDEGRWLAVYSREGIVTGLVGLAHPRALMVSRPLVAEHQSLRDALTAAPWRA